MPRDTVSPGYKIRLRGASGNLRDSKRRVITYSKAKFFDIIYKNQLLVEAYPFHPRSTTKSREIFAQKVGREVSIYWDRKLKARAKKAAKTREKKRQEAERVKKERERARLKAKKAKILKEKRREALIPPIEREELLKKDARLEEAAFMSPTRRKKVLKPVLIVPVSTKTGEYSKELIFKKVLSDEFGVIDLKVLNFTLKIPIEISREAGKTAKFRMDEIFTPHMIKFFNESKKSRGGYILRIKYNMYLPNGDVKEQGIGGGRFYIHDSKNLKAFLDSVVHFGYENFQKVLFDKYLSAFMDAEVTGFTLEVIERGGYP